MALLELAPDDDGCVVAKEHHHDSCDIFADIEVGSRAHELDILIWNLQFAQCGFPRRDNLRRDWKRELHLDRLHLVFAHERIVPNLELQLQQLLYRGEMPVLLTIPRRTEHFRPFVHSVEVVAVVGKALVMPSSINLLLLEQLEVFLPQVHSLGELDNGWEYSGLPRWVVLDFLNQIVRAYWRGGLENGETILASQWDDILVYYLHQLLDLVGVLCALEILKVVQKNQRWTHSPMLRATNARCDATACHDGTRCWIWNPIGLLQLREHYAPCVLLDFR